MYSATVKLIWRDSSNNYNLKSTNKVFAGASQMDVYEYIKYWTLKFGVSDVEMITEGETDET